jgi:hypothetical protein
MAWIRFLAVEDFLFFAESGSVLRSTQPPMQWIQRDLSAGIKRQGREAEHSPPSSAEVRNGRTATPFPHMPAWHNA